MTLYATCVLLILKFMHTQIKLMNLYYMYIDHSHAVIVGVIIIIMTLCILRTYLLNTIIILVESCGL
jgi:hypothetical protein